MNTYSYNTFGGVLCVKNCFCRIGLCPLCPKIEESVAKLEEVLAVRVNFTTSTMALEMDPEVDFHRVLRKSKDCQ